MSVIKPSGGTVPTSQATFWGPEAGGYSVSLRVRVMNDSASPSPTYTLSILNADGTYCFMCYAQPIAPGTFVDIVTDLKLPGTSVLQHYASAASDLVWSVTGVADDGS